MKQYLRKVKFTAQGSGGGFVVNPGRVTLHEMKIEFSISKSISSQQNSAEIKLWNLNESHRNSVGKEFDDITLEGGYMPPNEGGNVGILFKGQIRDVEHTRQGADIITTLSCGDGDKAFRRATTSKSYPKGTPVKDVVEDIYADLKKQGIGKGEWKFPDGMREKYERPYAVCGSCKRELDVIGKSNGFYWSVQNGVLEIIPGDGYIGGIFLITPRTGMIDVPAITDNGVKVSCLLNPEIRPGRRVRVESDVLQMNGANGDYRVSIVTYSGDNYDGPFKCDITGEKVNGSKVDEGKKK